MNIRRGLEKITAFAERTGAGKGKRAMLVALSVLLSVNIILASVPGAVFAGADSGVDTLNELLAAIGSAGTEGKCTISLSGSFDVHETIVIDGGKNIELTSAWGDTVLRRSAGFKGEVFAVSGTVDTTAKTIAPSTLTIANGVVVDGGSGSDVTASAPLVALTDGGVLNLYGTLQNNNNDSADSKGGAVSAVNKSTLNLSGLITGSKAYTGGGIYADGSFVAIADGRLQSNTSSYKGGGAYFTNCPAVSIFGSSTGDSPATVITGNSAPIGAGLYYANKPVTVETGYSYAIDYKISGGVIIDDNKNADSTLALPDKESNLFMEKRNDTPVLSGLYQNTSIGLYPMDNFTAITSDQSYITMQAPNRVFYDHDAEALKAATTHSGGVSTINTGNPVVILGNNIENGSVISDMGQEITDKKVYPYFPVHLTATTDAGYTIEENTFGENKNFAVVYNEGEVVKPGSAAEGIWYTFTDSSKKVSVEFTDALTPEAAVNGINYSTLSKAFAACEGKPYSEVSLLKGSADKGTEKNNVVLDSCITVPAGSCVKLSRTQLGTDSSKYYADLIIRSSSMAGDNNSSVKYTGSLFNVPAGSELILDGVTLDGNGGTTESSVTDAEPVIKVSGKLTMIGPAGICNGYAAANGGGVYLSNGTLDMKPGSRIFNNSAANGGGVYMTGADSLIIADGSTATNEIYSNTATANGGGVYMENGTIGGTYTKIDTVNGVEEEKVVSIGCDISSNTAQKGGGVYAVSGKIVSSTVGSGLGKNGASNTADIGGGIYAEDLALRDVSVYNNTATTKAGGVYYADDLYLSGKIVINNNKVGTAASNLYFDTAAGKPINISGTLTMEKNANKRSVINLHLSDAAAQLKGQDVAVNDSAADAAANRCAFAVDNSTAAAVVATDNVIELIPESDCVTVRLQKAEGSGSFDTVPDYESQVLKVPANGGTAVFTLLNPHSDSVRFTVSEDDVLSVTQSPDDENVYIVTTLEDAEKGGLYIVAIDTSYEYKQKSVKGSAEVDDIGTRYTADNYTTSPFTPTVVAEYAASLMNPHTDDLEMTYVHYGTGDAVVKSQISDARENKQTDFYDGYFVLEPVMTKNPGDGATPLGSLTEVPYVTVTLDVTDFADEGGYIDIVSYNGAKTTGNKGGAVLHNDLLVRDGKVSFDVTRSSDSDPDKLYVAILNHADYAAAIGTEKYLTLEQAFAAAVTGNEIKVLRDCTINSALVVPTGSITLSSESGATVTRSEFYSGAMVYVPAGSELTVKNIVLDGGASIYSTSPVTNSGVDASAAALVNYGTLSVSGSSGITNNFQSNDYNGGGLYNAASGKAVLKNAVLSGSYASFGGAAWNKGELKLEGCLVKGNFAKTNGAGIWSDGKLELLDTNITANSCSDPGAGGVYTKSALTVGGETGISGNTGSGAVCNVINAGESPIVINKLLGTSCRIGVTEPSKAGAVIATGDGVKVTDVSSCKVNFFPDKGTLSVTSNTEKNVVYDSKTATYVTANISAASNGTVSPAGDVRVLSGNDLDITATPDAGYAVADIRVDGTSVLDDADVDETTGIASLTIEDVKSNIKVEVTFKRAPGSVIEPEASTGGSISPSDDINVNSEDSVVFTITPDTGYYLDTLKLGGKDVLAQATANSDGSYTYVATGITDDEVSLKADFKPIYAYRTLTDESTGVTVEGRLHYKAYLTVESLAEKYPSLYNQMKEAMVVDKTLSQFIAQAYEIKLNFEDEQGMIGTSKIEPNAEVKITFNLGDSLKGKTYRIFHMEGNTIDTSKFFGTVGDSGKVSMTTKTLSPFAVVIQEKLSTGSTNGTTNGSTDGTTDNGKGPVSGDYSQPKTVPAVVIVLIVLSSAAIIYVVSRYYLPRLVSYLRARKAVR